MSPGLDQVTNNTEDLQAAAEQPRLSHFRLITRCVLGDALTRVGDSQGRESLLFNLFLLLSPRIFL